MKNSKKTLEELVEQFIKTLEDEFGETSTIIAISPKNSETVSCSVKGNGIGIMHCLDAIDANEFSRKMSKARRIIKMMDNLSDESL